MLISKTTKYLLGAAALAFVSGSIGQSHAAPIKPGGYPSRPITVLICFGKSGGSAQAVQAMKGPAAKIMGTRVNMVSKPGGGGVSGGGQQRARGGGGAGVHAVAGRAYTRGRQGE